MPERQEVDPRAADDLVGAQVDREEPRAASASSPPAIIATTMPQHPGAQQVGAVDAQEAAHQHHALEADVDHAAALGDDAAERREQQRRRVTERRRHQRRPGEHGLEGRGRRVRRCGRAGDREQRRPRSPRMPSLRSPPAIDHAPARRASAASTIDGTIAANLDRGDRDHPRDRAEDDARDTDLLWRDDARRASRRSCRRSRGTALARRGFLGTPALERHAESAVRPSAAGA